MCLFISMDSIYIPMTMKLELTRFQRVLNQYINPIPNSNTEKSSNRSVKIIRYLAEPTNIVPNG